MSQLVAVWSDLADDPRTCLSTNATLCTAKCWFAPMDGDGGAPHLKCYQLPSRYHHDLMCFRLICADIAVNSGRFVKMLRGQRLCRLCSQNVVEDEKHVVFECDAYASLRQKSEFQCVVDADGDMLRLFNNADNQECLAKYVYDCATVRSNLLLGGDGVRAKTVIRRCLRQKRCS